MAAISETLVREFFELHGFLVCQQRKYIPRGQHADEDIDFYVSNPKPQLVEGPLPAVLTPAELSRLSRAVVVVKGWHTETFGLSVFTRAPEIFRFLEPDRLKQATEFFGADAPVTKLLVIPALPRAADTRQQTVELMQQRGVDAVIPFPAILRELIERVEINRDYQKSDLLQLVRIFKNYDLFKEPQLELFKPRRTRRKTAEHTRGSSSPS